MQTMAQHDAFYRLQRRVEIDDAYRGGERAGHINGGRKAAYKTGFVAAVQTRPDGPYTRPRWQTCPTKRCASGHSSTWRLDAMR